MRVNFIHSHAEILFSGSAVHDSYHASFARILQDKLWQNLVKQPSSFD